MKTLTEDQAATLLSYMDAVDNTAVWTTIAEHMEEVAGIDNPEDALEDARKALIG